MDWEQTSEEHDRWRERCIDSHFISAAIHAIPADFGQMDRVERLAVRLTFPEERSLSEILSDPLHGVVAGLRTFPTWDQLYKNLPGWAEPSLSGADLSI
jgi:hypothetical protein